MCSIDSFLLQLFEVNTPIKRQSGNSELLKEFIIFSHLLRIAHFDILESALSFWLAFLHIFLKWNLTSITVSIVFPW